MPGLHPVHERLARYQPVAVAHYAAAGARLQHRRGPVHHLGEAVVLQQQPGEGGEVSRARGVVLVQADGIHVAGVVQPQLAGARVHLVHERLLRAGEADGERDGGVVRALEQQRLEQVLDRHPLALTQADLRFDRPLNARRELRRGSRMS